jgi:ClpP class serine protease
MFITAFSETWAITEVGAVAWQQCFSYNAPAGAAANRKTNFFGDTVPERSVYVVPVSGPMIKGAGFSEKGFGAVAHEDVSAMLSDALAESPKAIVLNVSSPGGTVRHRRACGWDRRSFEESPDLCVL